MEKLRGLYHSRSLVFVGGLLIGALIILGIRFIHYKPEQVHYHANFAVYINGVQEQFKSPKYYQDVATCSVDKITSPKERTHMHDNINSVIHVHDHAVTWGNFFEGLGWSVGQDYIITDDSTVYKNQDASKLHVYINGEDYTGLTSIANTVIKDQDRLLLSFGDIDKTTLQQEYKAVPNTAKHYDETKDPASCAGSHKVTISDRFHHLF